MMGATQMDLNCDRCGIRAIETGSRWEHKDGRALVLCLEHSNEHRSALARGWEERPVVEFAPEAGEPTREPCGICKESSPARLVRVSPHHRAVEMLVCPRCDVRTCNADVNGVKCSHRVADPTARRCPSDHNLSVVKR